jgi:predicted alpha/beta hydrolase family esterase
MKRVIIVHGWGGKPNAGWLAWLNRELSSRGFEVYAPIMPNPEFPKIKSWVSFLKRFIPNPDEDTYFVGHSIGCQTIMRYLEKIGSKTKVGGLFFVAGWLKLNKLKTKEEKIISTPWLEKPINFKKIKAKTKNIFALFSDNDPYVPKINAKIFKKELNAKIIIEKNKGHYIENITKNIPILLKEIIKK